MGRAPFNIGYLRKFFFHGRGQNVPETSKPLIISIY
jgi:hypothetical protein